MEMQNVPDSPPSSPSARDDVSHKSDHADHADHANGHGYKQGPASRRTSSRRRSLYRGGSVKVSREPGEDGPLRVSIISDTPRRGSVSVTRTLSRKSSLRSRRASRVEYHQDLKVDLERPITRNLVLGGLIIMFGASFLFGYNIGVLNQPVKHIQDFYNHTYTARYGAPPSVGTLTFLWSLTTALFLPGGMIGAYSAGFLADKMGRKRAIMFSEIFAILGAIISTTCKAAKAPELLMVGRFFTGINCGFATQLAPMFLTEMAPFNLRGAFGTGHQLFITVGIFIGSVFGLRELLGTADLWPYLLLINAFPAIVCLVTMPFIPDSPRYLLLVAKKRDEAEASLQFYRQDDDVTADLEEMETEGNEAEEKEEGKEEEQYTMMRLLKSRELRAPLMVAVMLQVIQQLSGINAVFFYSTGVYKNAGVAESQIQYAVMGTNAVNVVMTIVAVPVMDIAGRRPLLLYPMIVMVIDLVLITIAFTLQAENQWLSYISVICVIIYVICFAVGLGPIPTMIGAELFRQGPRPRAMSVAGLANWLFTMVVALSFESIQAAAKSYTFLIFLVLMVGFTIFVYFKVPETKGKTFEQIASVWQPSSEIEVEEIIEEEEEEEEDANATVW